MQLSAIKPLVEKHEIAELEAAENSLYQEKQPEIDVKGENEGEKLTHILAAIEILKSMEKDHIDFKTALRNYAKRVRSSIS